MKFSNLLKSAIVVATLLLTASEAYAQLPVRTRALQLLDPSGGTNYVQHATRAGVTANYNINWPNALPGVGFAAATDTAILIATPGGGGANLDWYLWSPGGGLDGTGNTNEITFWVDANTLDGDPSLMISVGARTSVTIGAAGVPGDLNINNGTQTTNMHADSASAAREYSLPDYSGTVVVAVNAGSQNVDDILVWTATGPQWQPNPLADYQFGFDTPAAGVFSDNVTFPVAFAGTPVVTIGFNAGTANIIQLTAVNATGFTYESTAPFDGTERIMWMANE